MRAILAHSIEKKLCLPVNVLPSAAYSNPRELYLRKYINFQNLAKCRRMPPEVLSHSPNQLVVYLSLVTAWVG